MNLKQITTTFSLLQPSHHPTMLEQLKDYTPFQLLVATLLSSRTKDTTTIPLVKKLFQKYPALDNFIAASVQELEKALYGVGFYRVKARQVKKLAQMIQEEFNGKVPETFDKLTSLPGVGRKTANCLLSYAFQKPAIAVDIHVHRISNRLGWVKTKTPEETEEALRNIVPRDSWNRINMLFVDHGQRLCLPRKPRCKDCPISRYCEYRERTMEKKAQYPKYPPKDL